MDEDKIYCKRDVVNSNEDRRNTQNNRAVSSVWIYRKWFIFTVIKDISFIAYL